VHCLLARVPRTHVHGGQTRKVVLELARAPQVPGAHNKLPSTAVAGDHMRLKSQERGAVLRSHDTALVRAKHGLLRLLYRVCKCGRQEHVIFENHGELLNVLECLVVVLSTDREGGVIVANCENESSCGVMGLVSQNDVICALNGALVGSEGLLDLTRVIKVVAGAPVFMLAAKASGEPKRVVNLHLQILPGVHTPSFTSPKHFFFGGSQEERDSCVAEMVRKYQACVVTVSKTVNKALSCYAKHKGPKSMVVINYEEDTPPPSQHPNATRSVNIKKHKVVYQITRSLRAGYPVHKTSMTTFPCADNVIVLCNNQPYNRNAWEGWIFHHIQDRLV